MLKAKKFLAALSLGLATVAVSSPAAAGVVVKSSGPSAATYPVGKKLDDAARITLKSGDSVTVLTSRGTRVIRGAGTHTVGARGASKRSAFAILTRQRAGSRVRTGAVRRVSNNSGAETNAVIATNPNLWNLDVSQGGRMCVADDGLINLWRPTSESEATYIFGSGVSEFHVHVTFDVGVSQASLTGEDLPLAQNSTYSISSPDGSPARAVEFVMLDSVPRMPEDMASTLAENGCTSQLDLLAERLMTDE